MANTTAPSCSTTVQSADAISTAESSTVNCENCGCSELEKFVVQPDNWFWFCPDCLLYQKSMRPPYEHYENSYHVHYAGRRDAKIRTGLTRLSAITPYLNTQGNQPTRMLDIGCSIGATVEAGQRLGWDASGVDVSLAGVEFCREQGLDCHKIDGLHLPYEDNTFDVVTSWHVIEHVDDVRETLQEWNRVVKPGGLLVIETPDSQCLKARRLGAEYQHFWPMDHLYTFTRSNMCQFLNDAGFDVLPSRIIGKLNALSPTLTCYTMGYRSLRQFYRQMGWCKSIEVCCRKQSAAAPDALKRAA